MKLNKKIFAVGLAVTSLIAACGPTTSTNPTNPSEPNSVTTNIDTSLFEDYIIVMSKESSNADMYAIFELKDSEESKDEALYFISQYEKSWDNDYFPEETAKVEDGLTKETDNYVIYIVNEDPDKILEIVEGK